MSTSTSITSLSNNSSTTAGPNYNPVFVESILALVSQLTSSESTIKSERNSYPDDVEIKTLKDIENQTKHRVKNFVKRSYKYSDDDESLNVSIAFQDYQLPCGTAPTNQCFCMKKYNVPHFYFSYDGITGWSTSDYAIRQKLYTHETATNKNKPLWSHERNKVSCICHALILILQTVLLINLSSEVFS